MTITLLTIGSRGDVQPFAVLGRALIDAGHDVRLATHPRFEPLVAAAGVPFAPLAEGAISAGPSTAEGRRWMESGSRFLPTWVGYVQDARTVVRDRLRDALAACEGSELIVASDLATVVGWQMHQHYGIPLVRASLNLPGPLSAREGIGARAVRWLGWRGVRAWLNGARRDVGLKPLRSPDPIGSLDRTHAPVLRAYSPAVGALPAAGRDWVHVTGYWFLDSSLDPDPPAELVAFLAAGEPPVCLDFGSMLEADPVSVTRMAIDALAGRRGVLVRGRYRHVGIELPDSLIAVDAISHAWLFERCAAVVHHAGAGTAAAVLRAGVPSVTVPHTIDQARWSRRMQALGVAGEPIPRRQLRGERLRSELDRALGDPGRRTAARALGALVSAERGTTRAVEILEHQLAPAPARERVAVGAVSGDNFESQER